MNPIPVPRGGLPSGVKPPAVRCPDWTHPRAAPVAAPLACRSDERPYAFGQVAQVFNLRTLRRSEDLRGGDGLPIKNRRYGRLENLRYKMLSRS
jgi:hypothetical protein